MKKLFKTVFLLTLFAASLQAKVADVLIAAPSVPLEALSAQELESVFLGTQTNWPDGTRITVGYVTKEPDRMEAFLQAHMGQSLKRYQRYWVRRVFSGYGTAPRLFKNENEALEFVKSTPGAIIFVPSQKIEKLSELNFAALD